MTNSGPEGFIDAIAPLLSAAEPTQESVRRAWRLLDENRKGHIDMEDPLRCFLLMYFMKT